MLIIVEFRITCHTDFAYIFSFLHFKIWRNYFKKQTTVLSENTASWIIICRTEYV